MLTDEQLDNLIFLPGLSTAETVSDISGRGVGMDVVRRNVERLGGRVLIRSVAGRGSTFYLSLPLTLAVLDGMVVGVGSETYIVPLTVIVESLRPQARDVHRLVGGGEVLYVRGEYVPLVYLGRALRACPTRRGNRGTGWSCWSTPTPAARSAWSSTRSSASSRW